MTPARLRGGRTEEDDAYENLTATLALRYAPDELTEVALTGRMIESETELDSLAEDPDAFETTQQRFGRVMVRRALFDGVWEPTVAAYHAHYERDNIDRPDAVSLINGVVLDTGDRTKFEWRNDLYLLPDHVVSLGVETEEERFTDNQNTDFGFGFVITGQSQASARTNAAYVQDQFRWGERLHGTLGARVDRHEAFDPELTYRFAPAYALPWYGLRLKGALGTGFRAPALFELFGRTANSFGGIGTGNPGLRPEISRSVEAGFDAAPGAGRFTFGAVAFATAIEDLIVTQFAFPNSTAVNIGEASIRGFEAFVAGVLAPHLSARLDYTFLRAEDATDGTDLLRRPRHKVDLDLRWQPTPAAALALGLHYIGAHADVSFDTGGRVRKGGYTVVDLAGSYALTDDVRVTGRLENLLDRDYEVADGFRGFGRAVLVGLDTRF
ncbi:MAG: TonB-dependent receptor [Alphaproteobacteria bacterium]|nr:TonB-dependent receptor [Alphaproteobacteria bacterium]